MSMILALFLTMGGEAAAASENANDPVICRRLEETGSRLLGKRVCMTKSEWEEQRRAQRMAIEKAQVQRPISGGD